MADPQDKALYLERRRIENIFARLKDWRPITMSYADAPTPRCLPSAWPAPPLSGFMSLDPCRSNPGGTHRM